MLFSFFSEGYYFRQREIGQAADFTPSKIIDLDCRPLPLLEIIVPLHWLVQASRNNVGRWKHRTIKKASKRGKAPSIIVL